MFITRDNIRDIVRNHISGYDGVKHVKHAYEFAAFPSYGWPGGCPIIYEVNGGGGGIVCADCAKKIFIEEVRLRQYDPNGLTSMAFEEGSTVHCDECNCEIESAYGEVR